MTLLIKEECSFLFLHIPKCGGSSVVELFKNCGYSAQLEMRGLPAQACLSASPQHLTCNELKTIICQQNLTDTFTLVRNPYKRIISEFNWTFRKKALNERPELNNWIVESIEKTIDDLNYADNHLRPMIDFIEPKVSCKIFKLEEGLSVIKEFYLCHHGDTRKIDIPKEKDATTFSHSISEESLNSDGLKAINSFYKCDFEAFGYNMRNCNSESISSVLEASKIVHERNEKVNIAIEFRKRTEIELNIKITSHLTTFNENLKERLNSAFSDMKTKEFKPNGKILLAEFYDDLLLRLTHIQQTLRNLTNPTTYTNQSNFYPGFVDLIEKYRSRLRLYENKK